MISTFAVSGYRSLHSLVLPLSPLTVITGENGSGKSNLYRALNLLADAASGEVVGSLARQGGLPSTLWAGPARLSGASRRGEIPIQGGPNPEAARLRLGFAGSDFGYLIELGFPVPGRSCFNLDPAIKRECIWSGSAWRQAAVLVDRNGALLRRREGRQFKRVTGELLPTDSLFAAAGDPASVPEVFALQHAMRRWRFYADFRTDADAPARRTMPATRTPVLHHDGRDLAAALQTIIEIGDASALADAIDDAFPGTTLEIDNPAAGRLTLGLRQPGLLRPLDCTEWSDGTLRYLLLIAALLTPRPPELMVLNEPETSLHPDLLPALARLMTRAASHGQLWVISHAPRLVHCLEGLEECTRLTLEKVLGRTEVAGLRELDKPLWRWPEK